MPVDSRHPNYSAMVAAWDDCQTFYDGERAVKHRKEKYIPRPAKAHDKEFMNYIRRAFFFPAMDRTVNGLAGAIDRKAPHIKLPSRISYIEEDADGNKATLRQFSKRALMQCFITGRFGILIERDATGTNPPYFVLYDALDIINWVDGNDGLQMVVLREYFDQQSTTDPFITERNIRYRVLRLEEGRYVQDLYEPVISSAKKAAYVLKETIMPTKAGMGFDYLPFVFGNVLSITAKIDKPPLLDLVDKNAENYRIGADYANSLYYTGNPLLFVRGVKQPSGQPDDFHLTLGSQRAVYLPNVESEIGMVECSGHGVSPNKDRFESTKNEMAVIGARLLESQKAGVEAEGTVMLRQNSEGNTLSNIVTSVSACIRKALIIANQWQGGNDDNAVEFSLNEDFASVSIDPTMIDKLVSLVDKGYMSWDTMFYNLASGELIPEGRDADEERGLIESEPPTKPPSAEVLDNPLNPLTGNIPQENPEE